MRWLLRGKATLVTREDLHDAVLARNSVKKNP